MVVYFADKSLRILGFAATHLPDGLWIVNDTRTDDVATGTSNFSFSMHCPSDKWNGSEISGITAPGGLVVRADEEDVKIYQILETAIDSEASTVTCDCEDAGLQLLGHRVEAVNEGQAHTADWYLARALTGTAFSVGDVDTSESLALSLSEGTCTEQILSIAEAFGAEPVYDYKIDQFGGLVAATVSLRVKERTPARHTWRTGIEITRLELRSSAAGAATDILARGATTSQGGQITLKYYPDWQDVTDTDEEGNVIDTITLDAATGIIHSEAAADRWGQTITRLYEGTATTQATLCEEALADLRARRDAALEIDVELAATATGAQAGDYVSIVDDARGIYTEARIMMLSHSVTSGTWAATVGDVIRKTSGISARLEALAAKLDAGGLDGKNAYVHIAYANSADGQADFSTTNPDGRAYLGQYTDSDPTGSTDPADYTWQLTKGEQGQQGTPGTNGTNGTDGVDALAMSIESSAGFVFVNADPSTTLTAHVWRGVTELTSAEIAAIGTVTWTRNGTTAGTGLSLQATAIGTYTATLANNGDRVAFAECSLARVDDVNSMTPEEAFNALTDNGRIQGIFRDAQTGDLYINMSYLKTGQLVAGGYSDNRGVINVVDPDGYNLLEINNSGIFLYNPPTQQQVYPYGPIVGQLMRGDVSVVRGDYFGDLQGAHLHSDEIIFSDENGQIVASFAIDPTDGPTLKLNSLKIAKSGVEVDITVGGNISVKNVTASGYISATGNIQTSGNVTAATGRVTAKQLSSTGKVIATGDITTQGSMKCETGLKAGGQIDGEAVPGLFQFVRASVSVNGGTVQAGDVCVLDGNNGNDVIDFSNDIPAGYTVQMVEWVTASNYAYFAPTSLILSSDRTYATARVRNLGSAAKDLTTIDVMLVCTRSSGYTP